MAKPHIGRLFSGLIGFALAGFCFGENVGLKYGSGGFSLNTASEIGASKLLENTYAQRIDNLMKWSKINLEEYNNTSTTSERKDQIVSSLISFYLVPVSHDRIFGKDYVIYNGKGKPTIIPQETYHQMKANWRAVLTGAGVTQCVECHRSGETVSAFNIDYVESARRECLKKSSAN